MELSKRLRAVAEQVRPGCRVCDIGTDHAYLPVYLLTQQRVSAAIASDVRPGPAAAARRTVEAAGLSDRVAVRLGDGLAFVSPDEVDDIVIAGMGGETIAAILKAAPWVCDSRYRLILQPMSHPEAVHAFLLQNGFAIEREFLVSDGHDYIVLTASFAAKPPVSDPFLIWRGGFAVPDGRPYWQKTAAHLRRRLAHSPDAALLAVAERLLAL